MGADDDEDCPVHDWGVAELHLTERGAEMVSLCGRCSAVRYESAARDAATRPPL